MKIIKFKITALLFFTLIIIGCTQKYYIKAKVTEGPDLMPAFCIGMSKACGSKGVSLDSIEISEVNQDGSIGFRNWKIISMSNEVVNEFTVGVVPEGWHQESMFHSLEFGVIYSINYMYFFYIDKEGLHEISYDEIGEKFHKVEESYIVP